MPGFADAPITDVMTRDPITARADASVESLIQLMTDRHIGCVPIVDERGRPAGIVTKLDVLECKGRGTAREIMMPHARAVGPDTTISNAATLMSKEGFHHLLIVDDERALLGIVSTFDLTCWIARQ